MKDFEALKRKFVFPAPFSAHGQKTVEGCLSPATFRIDPNTKVGMVVKRV
jgi:cell division protein YceG involved in septum cleavage